MMVYAIGIVIVIGSILAVFSRSDSDYDWIDIGRKIFKALAYIPMLLIGIGYYIAKDFNKHRIGYIVIFIFIAIIIWGVYMGFKAGPSGTVPWNS